MQNVSSSHRVNPGQQVLLVTCLLFVLAAALLASFVPKKAVAATSSTLNFQARLMTGTGGIVPDGFYNVEFKIYSASSGGAALWTETYYDSNGVTAGNDNRVRVANGYLTVNLGSQSAFTGINWDQEFWITMNIGGTTQTATPTWDGEMNPRLKLTAVPYAFRAGELAKLTGANTSTLGFATQTGARSLLLPDEGGTLCVQSSANCGFVLGASANFIQNTTSQQTSSNFYISGDGKASTSLQAPVVDSITGALGIGTNNATAINLNKSTTIAANMTLTVTSGLTSLTGATTGDALNVSNSTSTGNIAVFKDNATAVLTIADGGSTLVQPAVDSATALNVKNRASSANVLTVDTSNGRVGVNLGGNNTPTLASGVGGLEVQGALRLSGGAGSGVVDLFAANTGNVETKINIPYAQYSGSAQAIAIGIDDTSHANARGITVFDERNVVHHPSIGVASPDESKIFGLSWENSTNATAYLKTTASSSINISPNATDAASFSATAVNLLQNTTITGDLTVNGGDINTSAAASAVGLAIKPGNTTGNNGTGAASTLSGGDTATGTCGTACTGGDVVIQGGSATNGAGTRNGGSVSIQAGTGNTVNGAINIGTTTPTDITIGRTASGASNTIVQGGSLVTLQSTGSASVGRVQIGAGGVGSATPDYFALDVKSTTGDPAGGAEGYMYYNTVDNKFRCFQDSAWVDCVNTAAAGVTAIGTIDSQVPKVADGAQIVGTTLYMQTADASFPGLVSTGIQTFAGNKTFTGTLSVTASNTSGNSLSVSNTVLNTNGANLANLTFTNANSTATSTAVSGLSITPTGATNANANANTLNAINLPNVTTVTNNNFYALNVGTGYNDIIRYNGTQLISGTGKLQDAAIDSALTYTNLQKVGALSTGSITSGFGTISTGNNITTTAAVQGGTGVFTGANALTLGTTGTSSGAIVFKGSTGASGTVTLQGPANPSGSNFTLSIPAITANANVCTDNSICTGYAAAATTGNFLQQVPTSNTPGAVGANIVAPTVNSIIGLTVNGTTGTAATAAVIAQAGAADALNVNVTGSSQTNGILVNRTNAGTLTNGLNITNTSGTLTNGLAFTGTIGTDITRGSGTLSLQGNGGMTLATNSINRATFDTSNNLYLGLGATAAAPTNFAVAATGGSANGVAGAQLSIQGGAGTTTSTGSAGGVLALAGGAAGGSGANAGGAVTIQGGVSTSTGTSGAVSINSGNAAAGTAGNVTVDTGTTLNGTPTLNLGNANAKAIQIGNNTSNPSVTIDSGTGAINIGTGGQARTISLGSTGAGSAVAQSINLGTNTTAGATNTVVIGSTTATASTTTVNGGTASGTSTSGAVVIQSGSGGSINIGNNAASKTVNVGATAALAGDSTVNIATSSSNNQVVTIGSVAANTSNVTTIQGGSNATAAVSIQAASGGVIAIGNTNNNPITLGGTSGTSTLQGTIKVSTLGAATANAASVCRDTSTTNLINCDANTTGRPFLQGGNTFGATGTLGTNDANDLQFETNGIVRATFNQSNSLFLGLGATNAAPTAFTVAATGGTANGVAGAQLSIQGGAGTTTSTGSAGGALSLAGGAAGGSGANAGGAVSIAGGISTSTGTSGAVTINSGNAAAGTAGNVTLDTGTTLNGTPTVNIGNANAKAVQIGNNTSNPSVTIDSGTSNILIGTGAQGRTINLGSTGAAGSVAQLFNIGTNTTAGATNTVVIGSTTATASTTTLNGGTASGTSTSGALVLQAGTGGSINIGNTAASKTVNIGATAALAGDSTINIATSSSNNQVVTIGSIAANTSNVTTIQGGSNATAAVSIQAASLGAIVIGNTNSNPITIGGTSGTTTLQGTVKLSNPGTVTANAAALCRDSSTTNIIACDSTNTTGRPFLQSGNNFGATAVLGTQDANSLQVITNNIVRATIDTSNNLYLGLGATAAAPTNFTVSSTGSAAAGAAGANLTLQSGAGASATTGSAAGNLLLVGSNAGGSGNNSGGAISLTAGNSTGTTVGGGITLQAGVGGASANGGVITITGGTGGAATRLGGNVTVTGGTGVTSGTGGTLTLQGGTGGNAAVGGAITVQGGSAGGGNANGANVNLVGGVGAGAGVKGLVVVDTPTFSTATLQTSGVNVAITQANIDSFGAIVLTASAANVNYTLSDPTLGAAAAGRLVYVIAASGTNDFTLRANVGEGTGIEQNISMRQNTTATMIWTGTNWTAAGASSSTTLQAAYDNTLSSAGGAEIVLNNSATANGLTIRNNATTPIIGAILEAQTSIGSSLFSVNNNATEYASNGGAETAGGSSTTFPASTWSASATGGTQATVSRDITTGEFVTGVASTKIVTTGATTANQGAANQLSAALTANLVYSVSFSVKGTANFTTMDVVYSRDGTNTSTTTCATGKTVTQSVWSRIDCTFTAPSSGITSSNAIFIRQSNSNSAARTFYVDNLSVTVNANTNHAVDGSVDSALGTNWQAYDADGGAGTSTPTRDTTNIYDTSGAVADVTTAHINEGIRNNLTITPQVNTQYLVTFYAKLLSGTFTDLTVGFLPAGGSSAPVSAQLCSDYNTQTLSTSGWTKVTCIITTPASGISDPDVVIYQPTATARTFYVDALTVTLNNNNSSNVQIGGGQSGGPTTLFTLDRSASAPIASNNDAYLGSMYYDTTTGRIQCYESDGWGACGAAPDNIVNLNPEYAGAVLNGTGIGTMTADFCANQSGVLQINYVSATDPCFTSGDVKNFYKWTSPQATQQTYSIYVTYQLPATFNGFSSDDTVQLTGRVSSTANAAVTYQMYYKTPAGSLTQCWNSVTSETTVATSNNTWQSIGINGNEATGCSLGSSAANGFIIFKINLKANSGASAYASTLSFTTTGK